MAVDWDELVLAPSMAVFGEDACGERALPTYAPKGGTAFALADAVFDDGFKRLVLLDDGTSAFATTDPVLGVRLALFAAMPAQGDQVTIPRVGKTYVVKTVEPDSHGWALLTLNVVDPSDRLDFADPDDSALAGN